MVLLPIKSIYETPCKVVVQKENWKKLLQLCFTKQRSQNQIQFILMMHGQTQIKFILMNSD
jgi:hypothetical protein